MSKIVQIGTPVLREKALPVPQELFGTKELSQMITAMEQALDAEADGVALAAPQIALPYRIFIVRHDRMTPIKEGEDPRPADVSVFINPSIIKRSRKSAEVDEGCLSVRGQYGTTKRFLRVTVRASDMSGKTFERGAGGLLAQAFQHEIDHLDGVLFIDHATNLLNVQKIEGGE